MSTHDEADLKVLTKYNIPIGKKEEKSKRQMFLEKGAKRKPWQLCMVSIKETQNFNWLDHCDCK